MMPKSRASRAMQKDRIETIHATGAQLVAESKKLCSDAAQTRLASDGVRIEIGRLKDRLDAGGVKNDE